MIGLYEGYGGDEGTVPGGINYFIRDLSFRKKEMNRIHIRDM